MKNRSAYPIFHDKLADHDSAPSTFGQPAGKVDRLSGGRDAGAEADWQDHAGQAVGLQQLVYHGLRCRGRQGEDRNAGHRRIGRACRRPGFEIKLTRSPKVTQSMRSPPDQRHRTSRSTHGCRHRLCRPPAAASGPRGKRAPNRCRPLARRFIKWKHTKNMHPSLESVNILAPGRSLASPQPNFVMQFGHRNRRQHDRSRNLLCKAFNDQLMSCCQICHVHQHIGIKQLKHQAKCLLVFALQWQPLQPRRARTGFCRASRH